MSTSGTSKPVMDICVDCGADNRNGHKCSNQFSEDILLQDEPELEYALNMAHGRMSTQEASSTKSFYLHAGLAGPDRSVKQYPFTVSFYSHHADPQALPPFPYTMIGCVLGHTKFAAFVMAPCATDAQYTVSDFFSVVQVESVEPGMETMSGSHLRGTIVPLPARNIFMRAWHYLFGDV